MTKEQYLLVLVMEECAEVAQRASKALRFTLAEIQPEQNLSNAEQLVLEFQDLLTVMELLNSSKAIELYENFSVNYETKKLKIQKYYEYSKKLNRVT